MNKILKALLIITILLAFVYIAVSCKSIELTEEEKESEEEEESIDEESKDKELTVKIDDRGNRIVGEISDTVPRQEGHIMIGNVGDFKFNPAKIETIRNDIFHQGYFSIFDILVYLDNEDQIDMKYHFDEGMNTYVIDSINDMKNWWHIAYYDGGWPERNVFRMDHYPYKDKMYINISEIEDEILEEYYKVFREEAERKEKSDRKTIIPKIRISGPKLGTLLFENIELKPHNLRNDVFKTGTITAIDTIMTLGDEGKIRYDLNWYESIGFDAEIVKDYFVEGINEDISSGRCGFVYEEGSIKYSGFRGNHIHIPSDIRVLNSPEYEEWFWICL